MASEIMAKITDKERECDLRLAEAKKQAADELAKAAAFAAEYKRKKIGEAEMLSREIAEAAREKADAVYGAALKDSETEIAELRKTAMSHSAAATTAVAKQLVELT